MRIEEFEKIPTAWRQHHLKRENDVVLGKMLQSDPQKETDTEENYLRSANIQWTGVDLSEVKTMWFSPEEKRQLALIKGDLLVSEGGDVGRCCVWNDDIVPCFFQNAINRVRPRRLGSSRFLYYWLSNLKYSGFIDAACARITIAHLTAVKLQRLPVPTTPIDEQKRIAAYLDASCAVIDRAVETKQKQLEALDALRKSTIQKAVTQGLNPNVAMKDSGVEWLGTVPGHWTVSRIKRHTTMIRGKFSHRPRNDPSLYDGPYPFFQTGSIAKAEKYITEYHQTLNENGLAVSRLFPRGIIVMSIAANIGDVAITDFEGCFPDSIVGFVPDHHTDANFLFYLLKSMKPIMLRSAKLTTQLNLNYVRIGANICAYPPKVEQIAIAAFLDHKMDELRRISKKITDQIATLTAYRKSLIHECVTGKRRISDADVSAVQHSRLDAQAQ